MNINEAINQYKKAQKESNKASQAAKEASDAARVAWDRVPRAGRFGLDHNSIEYTAAKEASEAEAKAKKAADIAAAVTAAAGQNVLYVTTNVLRAAILANPEKFKKPCHYKAFSEAIQEITGPEFYLDNRLDCSLYICYRGIGYSHSATGFICDKDHNTNTIKINPERLNQRHAESTLTEIKKEAKKAVKDAQKIREAAAKLEQLTKDTKNNYNTYINIYLPYFCAWDLHDDKKL